MHILVIEDETKTRDYLRKGLTENGFVVDAAVDGVDGLHLAQTGDYDLIVADILLPGMDGVQLLRALRQTKQTPLVFLTGRDKVEDRVTGLETGADDYLVKPFAFSELLARVRTVLRRRAAPRPPTMRIADLDVDLMRRRVTRGGQRILLTAKEFNLLSLLLDRRGEALSKTLIAEQVWDMNFDSGTNVVEVAIRRLRAKIDDPFPVKLIHTTRGVGYVLEERP